VIELSDFTTRERLNCRTYTIIFWQAELTFVQKLISLIRIVDVDNPEQLYQHLAYIIN